MQLLEYCLDVFVINFDDGKDDLLGENGLFCFVELLH